MSNETIVEPAITDDTSIYDVDISVRLANILSREGLATIGDVRNANWDVLKLSRNMGRNTWREFVAFTVTYGIATAKVTPGKMANQALRDHFAGLAMQGFATRSPVVARMVNWEEDLKTQTESAYAYADAMLKAREQKP